VKIPECKYYIKMVPCCTASEFMKSSESVISFISSAIVVSTVSTPHQIKLVS